MKNLRMKVLVISILLVIPLAMAPFGYCGEGGPKDTERLVGPSIDAILVLNHTPCIYPNPCGGSNQPSCTCTHNCSLSSDSNGFVEATLLGICNGVQFSIEASCNTGVVFQGDLSSITPQYLTDPTTQVRINVPIICNPKPGQSLVIVDVKQFTKSLYLDQVTAKVILMFIETK